MFTSRPPHVTGVMFGSRDQYLEDEELLLAEIAQQQGIKTGAVLSNAVLGSATNFGQGFDDYIETYKILQGPLGARADTVTTAAARWLGGRTSDEPFFLWVHYPGRHVRLQLSDDQRVERGPTRDCRPRPEHEIAHIRDARLDRALLPALRRRTG